MQKMQNNRGQRSQQGEEAKTEDAKKRATMRYSVIEGSAWSVMSGFGDSFLIPFALALGANDAHIGFLKSLPQLANSLTQEVGAWLTDKVRNRLGMIMVFAALEALTWLALLSIPFLLPIPGDLRIYAVIALAIVYSFFGAIHHPAWVSLMADIVPDNMRGGYFGNRNKITGAVALASLLIAGYVLGVFDNVFVGFAALFAVAALGRFASVYFFSKHYEPPYSPAPPKKLGHNLGKLLASDFGRYLSFSTVLLFAVNLASPFFAVYMLRDLNLGYFFYALILGGEAVTRLLAMPYWGQLGDKFGNRTIMFTAGFLVPIIPLLWLVNQNPLFLFFIQVFSGFIWAGFDLAAFNYFLDSTTHADRTANTAHLNLAAGFATFAGASIGGLVALGTQADKVVFIGLSGIPLLFLISGVMRLLVSVWLAPRLNEVKQVEPVSERAFALRVLTVYPLKGFRNEMVGMLRTAKSARERVKKIVLRRRGTG